MSLDRDVALQEISQALEFISKALSLLHGDLPAHTRPFFDPKTMRCGNCMYFVRFEIAADGDADGSCRRHAPTAPTVPRRNAAHVFPPVCTYHGCAEFEPKPPKSPEAAS